MKAEAVAAAQERLEAFKAALEQRREELLAKEAQLKEAARAAEAAASAAAAQEEKLRAREVMDAFCCCLLGMPGQLSCLSMTKLLFDVKQGA